MKNKILSFFGIQKIYNVRVRDLRRLRKYHQRVNQAMDLYYKENPKDWERFKTTGHFSSSFSGIKMGIEELEKIFKIKI